MQIDSAIMGRKEKLRVRLLFCFFVILKGSTVPVVAQSNLYHIDSILTLNYLL